MEELNYRDPDEPKKDGTTCEDDDWDDEAASEEEELVPEEAHQSITHPV